MFFLVTIIVDLSSTERKLHSSSNSLFDDILCSGRMTIVEESKGAISSTMSMKSNLIMCFNRLLESMISLFHTDLLKWVPLLAHCTFPRCRCLVGDFDDECGCLLMIMDVKLISTSEKMIEILDFVQMISTEMRVKVREYFQEISHDDERFKAFLVIDHIGMSHG